MSNANLRGIMPAFMTPFDSDGALDLDKTKLLAERLISKGVDGLYVGGSSGEMILLTSDERLALLEAVMEVRGSRTVIAHVGATSTAETLRLARHARSVGADAVSSVTPFYFKYTFKEIKNFYTRIAEASELPVIVYSIPALTGMTLGFEQLCELLSLEGVAGMKFTMSDFFLLSRLKSEFPDKIIYNGSDEMLLSGLAAGADGGIGTTYNFMPELFVKIHALFRENRVHEAMKIQSFANKIIAEVLKYGAVPGSKQMVCFTGIDIGDCREPFLPLTSEEKNALYESAYLPLEKFIKEI